MNLNSFLDNYLFNYLLPTLPMCFAALFTVDVFRLFFKLRYSFDTGNGLLNCFLF